MHIPKEIDDDEILVRFIFLDHFKKKNLRKERISSQDIFLDDRLVGISLQRGKYTTENFCKQRAKTIDNKKYVGFVLFKKGDYLEACKEFIKERNEFHSIMEFTPLDEKGNYLVCRDSIQISDKGNPSHSDIIYINPAILPQEEKPRISLRIFSKILYEKCTLIIDDSSDEKKFSLGNFSNLI